MSLKITKGAFDRPGSIKNNGSFRAATSLCPRELTLSQFAEARAAEMVTMSNLVAHSISNQRMQQVLPVHMRRRAMSHNIKRFPRRLQKDAKTELDQQRTNLMGKRPSKKFRKRENRRLKNAAVNAHNSDTSNIWLKTHVWHAKRFRMRKLWNHSLPYMANEKCARTIYRAAKQAVVLHDVSYMCQCEITGDVATIVAGFSQISNSQASAVIDDPQYIDGRRRGQLVLYGRNAFPERCIGPALFLWMPKNSPDVIMPEGLADGQRRLWLWAHPACFGDVMTLLMEIFPAVNADVELKEIKDQLVMFRLIGATASETLSQVVGVARGADSEELLNTIWNDQLPSEPEGDMSTRSESSTGTVYSVMSLYPSLHRPTGTTTVSKTTLPAAVVAVSDHVITGHVPHSPIWCEQKRRSLITEVSDNLRGKQLISGLDLAQGVETDARVPVILIRCPATSGAVYSPPGWDIIIPWSAAMMFWKALIYRRVKVAALIEMQNIRLEFGLSIYPYSYPDTPAGQRFSLEQHKQALANHQKYPSGKRPNYEKLGVSDPFTCNWVKLMQKPHNGQQDPQSFVVLRCKQYLQCLHRAVTGQGSDNNINFNDVLIKYPNCLVPVTLTVIGRGALLDNTMICLPQEEDIDANGQPVHDRQIGNVGASIDKDADLNSRHVIGYLYLAGFSFCQGTSAGQGFVSLSGLIQLIDLFRRFGKTRVITLVRTPCSTIYRFAAVRVDVEENF